MGLFGPSAAELQLQNKLAAAQAALEESNAELTRTRVNEERLLEVADGDADTIRGLRAELERTTVANKVSAYIIAELDRMEASDQLQFLAEEDARKVVQQRVIDELTATLTNKLLDDEYARLVAEMDPATIDKIRAQLIDTFAHDGTNERIKADVQRAERTKIVEELLAAATAEAAAVYQSPEGKAALQAEIESHPAYAEEVATIRERAHRAALDAQFAKFKEAAPDIAQQEVELGKEDALAAFMNAWRESYAGMEKIAKLRQRLAKRVAEEGEAQVLATTENEALKELTAKREAQIARDLEAKVLLNDFTDGGIDTTAIPAGSRLELILGDTTQKDDTYYDPAYGSTRRGEIKIINEKRRLILTAQADGKFIVNFDSLADAKSVYEQNDAIPVGTVLRLGRRQIELDNVTLDNCIVYGVPIFYDTDDTDTEITSTKLKVRCVKLNHTFAVKPGVKKIAHVDGTTEDLNANK